MPSKNANNSGTSYEPVSKPGMVGGKPSAVARNAYGVFSASTSNPQSTKAVSTSNGIRNNSTNAAQA